MKDKLKINIVGIFILFAFVSMFLLSMVSAVLVSDQGTDVKNKSSGELLSLGSLDISIYDDSTAGSLIYQSNNSNAIVNGSWNLMISPTLEFGKSYWKDYAINGEDLDFDGNERIEFQSPLGLINNISFINFSLINSCPEGSSIRLIYANGTVECETDDSGNGTSSDLTNYALKNQSEVFAGNITTTQTGFFGWLGSLASRITKLFVQDIDVSGNITVTGNVSAAYFIGDGSKLIGLSSGTDSWATNYTLYPTKEDLYSNLSLTLLANGSRGLTGDLNFAGFNITNVGNITAGYICNSTNCYTLAQFLTTSSSTDSWVGNYTYYYNKTQIDNNFSLYLLLTDQRFNETSLITANNASWLSTYNATYHNNIDTNESAYIQANEANWLSTYNATYHDNINTDSWSTNYTDYYNGTIVNQIVISNDTWRTNYTNYYNATIVNQVVSGNSTGTDSWSKNYTFYYNKTQVDNNFSKFMSIVSWSTNLTNIFSQINLNYTSSLETCNVNLNNNLTSINNNINLNNTDAKLYANTIVQSNLTSSDSWSTNYTDYYNGTIVNQVVIGNDTWRTNISLYWLASTINNILVGNSTAWLSTYNATYANNLDTNESVYIQANEANWLSTYNESYVSTYNATYAANINNASWNESRANALYANITWNYNQSAPVFEYISDNIASWLSTYNDTYANNFDTWRTNYSSYYTGANINLALAGNLSLALLANGSRALTGDLNFAGFNITNVGNITAGYICNSTNCYTLAQFLVDTTGENTDSWASNYTYYYNKTRIDENFTKFMSIISWNTNITNIFSQINLNYTNSLITSNANINNNYTSSLTTCNANINNNLTDINNNINLNLTVAKQYTNTNIAGNLSLALLANGSRAMTGDLNMGGKNITNVANITIGNAVMYWDGTKLVIKVN